MVGPRITDQTPTDVFVENGQKLIVDQKNDGSSHNLNFSQVSYDRLSNSLFGSMIDYLLMVDF